MGFEAVVGRAVRTASAAESARAHAVCAAAGALLAAADALDAPAERTRFVAAHPAAFALPRPLAQLGDAPPAQDRDMRELLEGAADERDDAADAAARELAQRLAQLEASARALRAECREAAKTLDAAEAELVRQMEGPDAAWDVSSLFGPGAAPLAPAPPEDDAPRRDQEDYYLAVSGANADSDPRRPDDDLIDVTYLPIPEIQIVRVVCGPPGAAGEQGGGGARAPDGSRARHAALAALAAAPRRRAPPRTLRRAAGRPPARRAHVLRARHRQLR